MSFVCWNRPRKREKFLTEKRRLGLIKQENGIYYVKVELFPVQFICTSELSSDNNIWLKSLADDLEQGELVEKLLREYQKHQKNSLYKSVMNMVIRANWEVFEEEKNMCEALRELFGDELTTAIAAGIEEQLPRVVEERVAEIVEERVAKVRQEGINILIADNIEEGFSMDKILWKLEKRFGLTASEARGYLKQFTAG